MATIQTLLSIDVDAEFARRKHLEFIKMCWQKKTEFIVGKHTQAICERIDKAVQDYNRGESTFLIIKVPVRHGKSDIVSRYLPPHFLGQFPDDEVIVSGYGQTLLNGFSKFARNILRSKQYKRLYPHIELSHDNASVETWGIEGRQGIASWTGVGGGITGKGYNLGIIDDFVKDREQAESELIRDKQWEWFTDVFSTRAAPISITIILATPWHVDDIIGRIENHINPDGERYDPEFPKYEVINFPAKDDSYESGYLFSERFSEIWYKTKFALLGDYGSAGLLQCSPRKRGGNMFKVDRINIIDEDQLPEGLAFNRGWDVASTEKERNKQDPDYTCGVKLAVRRVKKDYMDQPIPEVYVWHVKRFQEEAPERNKQIKRYADIDGDTVRIGIESVAGYKDTYTIIRDELEGIRNVEKIGVVGDKVVRATPLEPIIEAGNFYIVRGRWNQAYLDEMESFPSGKHDDQVDGTITAYKMGKNHFDLSNDRPIVKERIKETIMSKRKVIR